MRLVRDLAKLRPASPSSVTIGVFDGVHRGHRQLIARMVAEAHAGGRIAAAYTFDPHPAAAMGHRPPLLLTTIDERVALLSTLGLDVLVMPSFTLATARTGAADFASLLINHLGMVELWAGPDFALGYQRQGDIPFLTSLGTELGFAVRVVEPMMCEANWVSSSRIRAALRAGELSWANRCLGRPYRLTGVARQGSALARASGLPVVTVVVSPDRLVPAGGVYACLVHSARMDRQAAVAYVQGSDRDAGEQRSVEAHLVGVGERSGDPRLALDFVARLRDKGGAPCADASRTVLLEDARQAQPLLDARA